MSALSEARRTLKLTQTQLGASAGQLKKTPLAMSRSRISRIERGWLASLEERRVVASTLGRNISDLFDEKGKVKLSPAETQAATASAPSNESVGCGESAGEPLGYDEPIGHGVPLRAFPVSFDI